MIVITSTISLIMNFRLSRILCGGGLTGRSLSFLFTVVSIGSLFVPVLLRTIFIIIHNIFDVMTVIVIVFK